MIKFYVDKCQGCGLCVEACPKKLLMIDKSKVNARGYTPVVIMDEGKCSGCSLCAVMCPDLVIEISKERA